ncbi:MAG: DEAD/DEAH box helicase [Acidimicrobiales bacterium]
MTAAQSFADLGVSAEVVDALGERGITEAFPIQVATIEAALDGQDICGKAPTGSGKTLAFGIPTVELVEQATSGRPRALILSPTRELASQIDDEISPLAKARDRSVRAVYGGTNIEADRKRLRSGIDILVATPGRLEDLISRGYCDLGEVGIVVVDEADRMADMGFLPAVERILDQTSNERSTMLFSATLDGDVNTLIRRYQDDPFIVQVEGTADDSGDVDHKWFQVPAKGRIDLAARILQSYTSAIVFCRTRRGCERVTKQLVRAGVEAVAIHGDRSQAQRERALRAFAEGKAYALVATDVAARGIHVDDVTLVLHFDPPETDKDYVHRSGRTGRAGADGQVISLIVSEKIGNAKQIQKALHMPVEFDELDIADLPDVIERASAAVELDELRSESSQGPKKGYGAGRDQSSRGKSAKARRTAKPENRAPSGRREHNPNRDDRPGVNQLRGEVKSIRRDGGKRSGGNDERSDRADDRSPDAGEKRVGRSKPKPKKRSASQRKNKPRSRWSNKNDQRNKGKRRSPKNPKK